MKEQYKQFYQDVGHRIRDERIKQGLSQAELAEKADLSLPVISSIENGHSTVWLVTFAKIAIALQVAADDLLRLQTAPSTVNYPKEFYSIFDGCTPSEREAILKVSKEMRNLIDIKKSNL